MNAKLKIAALFSIAAFAGVAVSASSTASAWYARKHASHCFAAGTNFYDANFSLSNQNTASAQSLICPAVDETGSSQSTITSVNVHGNDANASSWVSAEPCRANA